MNIVRFNEPFQAAIAAWESDHKNFGGIAAYHKLPFDKWETSPLFQYTTTMEKEKNIIRESLLGTNMRLESAPWPFETFRLAVDQSTPNGWIDKDFGTHHGDGRYVANFVITRKAEQIHFLGHVVRLYDESPTASAIARKYAPLIIQVSDAYTCIDNPDEYRFNSNTFASGRWMHMPHEYLVQGLMDSMAGFVLDSMVPLNHIVEVRPNQPGRSVEWTRARTHYTLITHGHPANKKKVREGERVNVNQADELRRMAGNRKGHYKQLRHPRYRFALNEKRFPDKPKGTIYVNPCWCGPKEWQDFGGKQIYRILEPIDEE